MNPRHEQLVQIARSQGPVTLEVLAERLNVSVQTVRRDVQQLAQTGQLVRFHGGVRAGATAENITYQQRSTLNAAAKARIGHAVAARIPDDRSLMLTVGTPTFAVARELRAHRGLRIVTNDMAVAQLHSTNREMEVHLCGGGVRARDHASRGRRRRAPGSAAHRACRPARLRQRRGACRAPARLGPLRRPRVHRGDGPFRGAA